MSVRPDYRPRRKVPLQERILRSVVKREDGCWIWQLFVGQSGYGHIEITEPGSRGPKEAHRVSYEVFVGPIPPGLQLDHLCRVRACVNPSHPEPVTPAENSRRAISTSPSMRPFTPFRQRATSCRQGHPFDEENTRVTKNGHQSCRTCDRLRKQAKKRVAEGANR